MLIMSSIRLRVSNMVELRSRKMQVQEGDGRRLAEVDHVEDLRAPVLGDACEQLAVGAGGHSDDRCEVSTIMLDKLNSLVLLLPEL
jgi:hypothetical protein